MGTESIYFNIAVSKTGPTWIIRYGICIAQSPTLRSASAPFETGSAFCVYPVVLILSLCVYLSTFVFLCVVKHLFKWVNSTQMIKFA